MTGQFKVVFTPSARNDLENAYTYAASREPAAAAKWYRRFVKALQTLAERPERCPFSSESNRATVELRDYLFGKRPYVFRVIFTIRTENVLIVRILRSQQRGLSRNDIQDALDET